MHLSLLTRLSFIDGTMERGNHYVQALLLVFFLLLSGAGYAGPKWYKVPLVSNLEHTYVVGEFYTDWYNNPVMLFPGVERLNDKQPGNIQLLRKYYQLLVRGEDGAIANLYFGDDGSKDEYLDEMKATDGMHEGYKSLEQVNAFYSTYWGEYIINGVNLSGGGQNMAWREATFCNDTDKCSISKYIDKINEKNKLYATIFAKHLRDLKENKSEDAEDYESWINFALLPDKNIRNGIKQYPVQIFMRLDEFDGAKLIEFNKDVSIQKSEYSGVIANISSFVRMLKAIPGQITDEQANEILRVVDDAYKPGMPLGIYRMVKNDLSLVTSAPSIFSVNISKWDACQPLGVIKTNNYGYLYIQPYVEGEAKEVQVFSFNLDDKQSLTFNDSGEPMLWMIRSPITVNQIMIHKGL